MTAITATQIWVNQQNLANTRVVTLDIDTDNLGEDEVLLNVDSFGFSANNITYAALGFKMGYWGFFPAAEGYGIVPVWGFATVVASNHNEVKPGEKVFGYLPMASHWVIKAGKAATHGFSDIHEKRKSISPVYDQYLRVANDPGYNLTREAWQLNFRPLYMTSFVLDDYVASLSHGESLLLSSASSKTALGTAQRLKAQKQARNATYQVIGLTSPAKVDMVKQTGCYDKVIGYDNLHKLDNTLPYWLLDFAANGGLIDEVTKALGKQLNNITLIGATDWKANTKPNPKALAAEIFFAPARVKLRQQEWGHESFLSRYAEAWKSFANNINDTFYEQHHVGTDDIITLYLATLDGSADTQALNVLSFN
ncbi:DUF2855 family protein [Alteromonas sp. 345S023]|uniref:DUF2855 family protein n=1 Tax=Alteromonas profundi TaxID=2696062 RepID=A0A7X5LK06_9ALTE|nr:DUF2855 family protein [Alteromonas profundi]NDV90744.1 DUF2855 family protein [Alteromonas profundi]